MAPTWAQAAPQWVEDQAPTGLHNDCLAIVPEVVRGNVRGNVREVVLWGRIQGIFRLLGLRRASLRVPRQSSWLTACAMN